MRPLLSVFPLRSLTALVTLYSPVESNCYEEEDVIVPKVIQCHPYSYLSLLFMKRTQCVKEVQGVLTPLSWAEHNCNTFTGITFLIELWRTKLHSSIVITTSLFYTSSKSLKVWALFSMSHMLLLWLDENTFMYAMAISTSLLRQSQRS